MQHSMLHTIYTLLSVPNQVPNGLLSSFQSAIPLLAEIDSQNYQSWQQQLIELAQQIDQAAQRQRLNHKTVVGFGGGFSAGKSRFINSLLGVDVLPEALEPCTAVATYLTHSPQKSSQACNLFGHQIQLKSEQLGQLRHFVDSADSINLGQLIRHVHLGLPEITWSNIALLDTPGYSKADSQHHGQNDENIALSQLSAAQHVVWLVNAKNGTIRDEDLQFLQKLALKNPIFVVLTQSDLVNRADLKPIMAGISKHLASKNVAVAGIMAWAAPISQSRGERLAGDNILEWFERINQPVWQSYQDQLDFLIAPVITAGQTNAQEALQQQNVLSQLLGLPALAAEQTQQLRQQVILKQQQQTAVNSAMVALHVQYRQWMELIEQLGLDSVFSVQAIQQQQHSIDTLNSFYKMAELFHQKSSFSNIEKATKWYVQAAVGGHMPALNALIALAQNHALTCYWLAEVYLYSKLNSRLKAARYYEQALALGESLALPPARRLANDFFKDLQYQIGLVYTEGKITQRDPAEAARWYEKAANQEHILAQVAFADDLCQRLGDRNKALVWYQSAAHQGHIESAYQAAGLHEYFSDLEQATHYMSLAAKSSHVRAYKWLEHHEASFQTAAYCLAQMYESGEGIKKCLDTAIKKYAVLVRQQHTPALQQLLGLANQHHHNALLTMADIAESYLKDLPQAAKWHSMAVDYHDDQQSLQWLYDQSCSGLQDAQDCLKSLADRLKRANLQYRYGLFSAYKNLKQAACDYMALAAYQTHAEAYQWLKQQSAKNDSYAQSKMMRLFEYGRTDQEDTKIIFDYYYSAIRRGDAKAFQAVSLHAAKEIDIARHLLATCYAFGYGVKKDYQKAYDIYEKASAIPDCYYNRAVMLYLGLGVAKDKKSAVLLLEQKIDLFSKNIGIFCNPFMLKTPILVDFESHERLFKLNSNELLKLNTGVIFLLGLICFFGGVGFLWSVFLSIFFLATRLWSVGAFSGQTTVANNQTGAALKLAPRNPYNYKANSHADTSNLTTSPAGAASKKDDLAHRNSDNHKANSDFDSSNLTTRQAGAYYNPSTNLTWMRCSLGQTWNGTTCVGTAKKYTWDEAQQALAEMNRNGGYAGYTDWVLPDIDSLKSLLQKHEKGVQINNTVFPNTPDGIYWSASPASNHFNGMCVVGFSHGDSYSSLKSNSYYIRAVRVGR